MRTFLATAAIMAVGLMTSVSAQSEDPQQPTQSPAAGVSLRTPSSLGCYSDPGDMWDMGPYEFQTDGWCQPLCVRQAATYFALVNGTNCFCGNSAPESSKKVSDSECDTFCGGFKTQNCGGTNRWQIFADGFRNGDSTGTIQITTMTQTWYGHEATTSSTLKTSVSSNQQSTVVVTASSAPDSTDNPSSTSTPEAGPNKAGIAAGVVVGVVALAGIVGGVFFYMRRKKQTALEEERRRHESMMRVVQSQAEKPPSSFGGDSRLEPGVMFQRRQSDGSIMDNEDYSRRILKVTNPDGR